MGRRSAGRTMAQLVALFVRRSRWTQVDLAAELGVVEEARKASAMWERSWHEDTTNLNVNLLKVQRERDEALAERDAAVTRAADRADALADATTRLEQMGHSPILPEVRRLVESVRGFASSPGEAAQTEEGFIIRTNAAQRKAARAMFDALPAAESALAAASTPPAARVEEVHDTCPVDIHSREKWRNGEESTVSPDRKHYDLTRIRRCLAWLVRREQTRDAAGGEGS